MVMPVLKFSDIKKNPSCLTGWEDKHVAVVRYSEVVAYVVTPERMEELLYAEEQLENAHLNGIADQKRISVKLEDL